jgi:hypothetical protein
LAEWEAVAMPVAQALTGFSKNLVHDLFRKVTDPMVPFKAIMDAYHNLIAANTAAAE